MRIFLRHLDLGQLSAFVVGELDADAHRHAAAHLRDCARCQDALRFIHTVSAPAESDGGEASQDLLARILASRASGARVILPAAPSLERRRSLGAGVATAAAVVLVLVGLSRVLAPTAAMAASDRSTLTVSPAAPMLGARVTVHYTPAATLFPGPTTLAVRARFRTPDNVAYGVPSTHTRRLGLLTRSASGAYTGSVTLPDSAVYLVLAVESVDSARVDDDDGPGWEVLVAGDDGRPLLAALDQRSNDMMGRSWEQGYASARRATELYPDAVDAWTTREFFERQLFTGAQGDSAAHARAETMGRLVAAAKASPALSYRAIGSVYYRAYSVAATPGATKADSSEWDYWWARIQREYPRHEQIAQRLALWMDARALGNIRALDSLGRLYDAMQPLHGPGKNLINRAMQLAAESKDATRQRLWFARAIAGAPDSAKRMATFLADKPAFRSEGMHALRGLLRPGALGLTPTRGLSLDATQYARLVADARRAVFAALGRALLAEGAVRPALDTLRLAAEGGWDAALHHDLARSYALAGDTAAVLSMNARLVVDARTTDAQRDSLRVDGTRRLGAAAWSAREADARREMYERTLERSVVRAVGANALVRSRAGRDYALGELTGGSPALVIFWSRHCGYALAAIPEISSVVSRLTAAGVPVVVSIDEAPSAELDQWFVDHKLAWPIYYDAGARLATAMRNFGTPSYYVLDQAQRIRYTRTDALADLIVRVESLRGAK